MAAAAVHADGAGARRLRVAVRDGYDVLSESVPCGAGAAPAVDALERTALGGLPAAARDVVRAQVTGLLSAPADG